MAKIARVAAAACQHLPAYQWQQQRSAYGRMLRQRIETHANGIICMAAKAGEARRDAGERKWRGRAVAGARRNGREQRRGRAGICAATSAQLGAIGISGVMALSGGGASAAAARHLGTAAARSQHLKHGVITRWRQPGGGGRRTPSNMVTWRRIDSASKLSRYQHGSISSWQRYPAASAGAQHLAARSMPLIAALLRCNSSSALAYRCRAAAYAPRLLPRATVDRTSLFICISRLAAHNSLSPRALLRRATAHHGG